MKSLTVLLLSLGVMSSLAMSQTSAPPTPPSGTIFLHDGIIFVPDCDMSVSVHGKSKKIAEIFPDECSVNSYATVGGKPVGSGEPITSVRIADCDEEVGVGGHIYTLRELGYCTQWKLPEPSDVPAIQEEYVKHEAHECWGEGDLLRCAGDTPDMGKRWTCADKANYALLTSVDGSKHICHRLEGK